MVKAFATSDGVTDEGLRAGFLRKGGQLSGLRRRTYKINHSS